MYDSNVLIELVNKCDKLERKQDPKKYRKMCKALIAALFLTGGRVTEVLMLKKDNFVFDDPEATKNNSFLVQNMVVVKSHKQGKPVSFNRTFPIMNDDPLVSYLIDWVKNNVDDYLFPTSHRAFMHPTNAFKIVRAAGNLLDRPLHINCKWFREQRKHFLVEVRGFSVYDLQAYMKLRQTPKISGGREDWQNLLQITSKSDEIKLSKTGLDPEELRNLASKMPCVYFPTEVWEKMTDIEKSDFSDAAKCLLSGLWTPAALVAWRGSEASIKNYYKNVTGKDPDSHATWRRLTRELKDKSTDFGIKDNFASYLDYYGDAKRNFVLHPNKVFSLREASQFFMNVVGLVSDIYLKN